MQFYLRYPVCCVTCRSYVP